MIGTSDSLRSVRRAMAGHLGEHEVQDHERRRVRAERLDRAAPAHADAWNPPLEVVPDRVRERLLVLDDQDAGRQSTSAAEPRPGGMRR